MVLAKTEEPSTEEPNTEEPSTEEPKTEEPKTETPRIVERPERGAATVRRLAADRQPKRARRRMNLRSKRNPPHYT